MAYLINLKGHSILCAAETLFSPRGSMLWSIDANWKVRAAAGRYNQFPELNKCLAGSEIRT